MRCHNGSGVDHNRIGTDNPGNHHMQPSPTPTTMAGPTRLVLPHGTTPLNQPAEALGSKRSNT